MAQPNTQKGTTDFRSAGVKAQPPVKFVPPTSPQKIGR
jgi:hypothetical protein